MLNIITNILGILLIISAAASVFFIEKIDWMDASFGITAGAGLIYVKNNKLIDVLKRPK